MPTRTSILGVCLLVPAVLFTSLAIFGHLGIAVALFSFGLAIGLSRSWPLGCGVLVIATIAAAIGLAILNDAPRQAAGRALCANNLKLISVALQNYHAHYGSFPPPRITDNKCEPLHSWRVLILPYLEQEELYRQYNFREPWDGPNNKRFLPIPIWGFQCPRDEMRLADETATTSYLAVLGPKAAWQANKPTSLQQIAAKGDPSSTVLLIDSGQSGIGWSEPRDFSVDALDAAGPDDSTLASRCPHRLSHGYFYHDTPAGAHVLFADGHIRFLPAGNFTPSNLQRLLAVGGCKEENIIDSYGDQQRRPHVPHCLIAAAWAISVVALLYLAARIGRTVGMKAPGGKGKEEVA